MASRGKRSPAKRARTPRRPAEKFSPKPQTPYAEALAALEDAAENLDLEVDGARLKITHLNKLLWPSGNAKIPSYTRRDYLRHLLRVGSYLLAHLRHRPLTLIRMPEGITGRRFVHFHYEQRLPAFVETVMIFSEKNARPEEFLLCNNMPTVLWLAHIGTLELHAWHSRANTKPDAEGAPTDYMSSASCLQRSLLNYPDYLVFDLDPYIYSGKEAGGEPELNTAAFEKSRDVAFWLRALLDSMHLESYVKTSGKTGLHVLVPIVRKIDFDSARAFAETIGRHLTREHPEAVTIDWSVKRRTGKVFVDYNMNVRVKTLSAPYSVRGLPGAPVSMPLTWKELEHARPLDYTMVNVAALLASRGDIWRDLLESKQNLREALR